LYAAIFCELANPPRESLQMQSKKQASGQGKPANRIIEKRLNETNDW
jgi:hypothetical protein